jgi:hypothetical protein
MVKPIVDENWLCANINTPVGSKIPADDENVRISVATSESALTVDTGNQCLVTDMEFSFGLGE